MKSLRFLIGSFLTSFFIQIPAPAYPAANGISDCINILTNQLVREKSLLRYFLRDDFFHTGYALRPMIVLGQGERLMSSVVEQLARELGQIHRPFLLLRASPDSEDPALIWTQSIKGAFPLPYYPDHLNFYARTADVLRQIEEMPAQSVVILDLTFETDSLLPNAPSRAEFWRELSEFQKRFAWPRTSLVIFLRGDYDYALSTLLADVRAVAPFPFANLEDLFQIPFEP